MIKILGSRDAWKMNFIGLEFLHICVRNRNTFFPKIWKMVKNMKAELLILQ